MRGLAVHALELLLGEVLRLVHRAALDRGLLVGTQPLDLLVELRVDGGAGIRRIRSRLPASSIRSIALSGRKRSEMYRSARFAAATSAWSVIVTSWCSS